MVVSSASARLPDDADAGASPFAVNVTPNAGWVRVAEQARQTVLTNVVVALQHRETTQRGRNPDRSETRMTGSRVGATVVHRRRDRYTGRHLVVQ